MPTYEDLRAYFDESETLQSVTRQAAEVPIVTGFTIDVHPLWILLYDLDDGLFGANLPAQAWVDRFIHSFQAWPLPLFPEWASPAFQGYRRRELKRKIDLWRDPRSPIVLTIVHRPVRTPVTDEPDGDEADRLRLVAIANSSPALVQVEERPMAALAFAPGDAIHTSQSRTGTYGGTLTNRHGTRYGMSCAHVAETGDTITDKTGGLLGTCKHHTKLVDLGSNVVCDPVNLAMPNPSPGNGPSVNMLDFSLIKMKKTPAFARSLSGTATTLTIGQDVDIEGALTNTHCRLGSLALSYAFVKGGKSYCFRDSIELKPRPRFGIGGSLGTLFSTIPTQGDSGAWVLTKDTPPAWAAVFFAEDGQRGYCIRAKWAKDWTEQLEGPISV